MSLNYSSLRYSHTTDGQGTLSSQPNLHEFVPKLGFHVQSKRCGKVALLRRNQMLPLNQDKVPGISVVYILREEDVLGFASAVDCEVAIRLRNRRKVASK